MNHSMVLAQECVVGWDVVEELLAAKAHKKAQEQHLVDPLEAFCNVGTGQQWKVIGFVYRRLQLHQCVRVPYFAFVLETSYMNLSIMHNTKTETHFGRTALRQPQMRSALVFWIVNYDTICIAPTHWYNMSNLIQIPRCLLMSGKVKSCKTCTTFHHQLQIHLFLLWMLALQENEDADECRLFDV